MKRVGRNDPCPCGSGKKFKKCCEPRMIGKRFLAQKLEGSALEVFKKKATGFSSLFQRNVTPISPTSEKTFKAQKVLKRSREANLMKNLPASQESVPEKEAAPSEKPEEKGESTLEKPEEKGESEKF